LPVRVGNLIEREGAGDAGEILAGGPERRGHLESRGVVLRIDRPHPERARPTGVRHGGHARRVTRDAHEFGKCSRARSVQGHVNTIRSDDGDPIR
jgi:hypothetical protein